MCTTLPSCPTRKKKNKRSLYAVRAEALSSARFLLKRMMYFSIVIPYVLWMLAYMLTGFVSVKAGWAETPHARSLSGLLIYVCGPAMFINAFQRMNYDPAQFRSIVLFFLVTLAIQAAVIGILCLLLRKRFDDARYRILSIATVLGNVGFLGLPLVTALFPGQPIVACYSTVYALSMNLVVFTLGVFLLTRDRRYMSLKAAVLNPTSLTILFSLPFYLLDIHLPEAILDNLALLGRMSTPMCMFVLGMRLAAVDLKGLLTQPFSYIGSLMKLIAYPLAAYLMVRFLPGLDETFKACVLVLSAAPSGAIILSLAELHRREQENAASVLLMSTLLCVITIPLVMLIL